MPFWFNTRTNQVESADSPDRARIGDLMGPYESEEQAREAYTTAADRTAAWDDEDREEEEWRSGDADSSQWDNNPLNDND
ncbi:methionine aminopeptidase [Ornithinimicrobium sp. Y1694]|uniref:methionine aminopeptidase n=1 Tax=Ornithinimicrobium sp. Y1694 TaxID=3418590 RepID=UPI003CF25427